MRTLTRIIFVLALSLTVAVPASAAVDPADRAWITAAGLPVTDWELEWPGAVWSHDVTVRSTGSLPGREGNRHTAAANFNNAPSGRFPQPWLITLTDEQCSPACAVVKTEELALLPSQATVTGPAADGTVRIVAATPAVDVTIAPAGWRDLRDPPDLSKSSSIARNQSTLEDRVITYVDARGQSRVTGSIAGVAAQEVPRSSWVTGGRGLGTVGPPLKPTTDRATLLQYAPPQTRGRVTDRTVVNLEYGAVARGTLTTSTGQRLKGNAFQVTFFPSLDLQPGDALAGTRSSEIGISTYQCPAATTPLTECEYYEHAEIQKINSSGPLRYGVTPLGALALQVTVPVTREVDEGQSPEVPLGTVTFTAALAPTGAGRPGRTGDLGYSSPGSWRTARTLERGLSGAARLGSLTARPAATPLIRFETIRTGLL